MKEVKTGKVLGGSKRGVSKQSQMTNLGQGPMLQRDQQEIRQTFLKHDFSRNLYLTGRSSKESLYSIHLLVCISTGKER